MKERLDWEAARLRLERSRQALDRAFAPDAGFAREIFRKRAEWLARAPRSGADTAGEIRALVFTVAGGRYALEITELAETVTNAGWSPVPGAPATLRGVMQVHGEICPVWDLARMLRVDNPAPGHAALVLRRPGRPFALAVQSVDEIRTIRREDLQPPPAGVVLVKGIDPDLVALLDAEEIAKETAR